MGHYIEAEIEDDQHEEEVAQEPSRANFGSLSMETVIHIMSYLDPHSLQKASQVCRFWNNAAIEMAKNQRWPSIRLFGQFLCQKLEGDRFAPQKARVLTILENSGQFLPKSLREVARGGPIKEAFAAALHDLTPNHIPPLKAIWSIWPRSFANFFDLVYSHIYLREAQEPGANYELKDRNFSRIAAIFAIDDQISKAIAFANTIPSIQRREKTLVSIASFLTKEKDVLSVIEQIGSYANKIRALCCFIGVLAKDQKIDQALGHIDRIKGKSYQSRALYVLATKTVKDREVPTLELVERVRTIIERISTKRIKDQAFLIVGKKLGKMGFLNDAETFFWQIEDEPLRNTGFELMDTKYDPM